jgi:hypothetical protein
MMKGGKSRKASRKGSRKSRKATRKMRGGQPINAAVNANAMKMVGGQVRAIGSRAEVMHGTAHHTSGGLTRKDLKYNKAGRIVSRKASEAGKKALKRLERAGYKARKGQFKLFTKKSSRK